MSEKELWSELVELNTRLTALQDETDSLNLRCCELLDEQGQLEVDLEHILHPPTSYYDRHDGMLAPCHAVLEVPRYDVGIPFIDDPEERVRVLQQEISAVQKKISAQQEQVAKLEEEERSLGAAVSALKLRIASVQVMRKDQAELQKQREAVQLEKADARRQHRRLEIQLQTLKQEAYQWAQAKLPEAERVKLPEERSVAAEVVYARAEAFVPAEERAAALAAMSPEERAADDLGLNSIKREIVELQTEVGQINQSAQQLSTEVRAARLQALEGEVGYYAHYQQRYPGLEWKPACTVGLEGTNGWDLAQLQQASTEVDGQCLEQQKATRATEAKIAEVALSIKRMFPDYVEELTMRPEMECRVATREHDMQYHGGHYEQRAVTDWELREQARAEIKRGRVMVNMESADLAKLNAHLARLEDKHSTYKALHQDLAGMYAEVPAVSNRLSPGCRRALSSRAQRAPRVRCSPT